jgi:hypothetical protein
MGVVERERRQADAASERNGLGKGEKGAEMGKRYYFDETNLPI